MKKQVGRFQGSSSRSLVSGASFGLTGPLFRITMTHANGSSEIVSEIENINTDELKDLQYLVARLLGERE